MISTGELIALISGSSAITGFITWLFTRKEKKIKFSAEIKKDRVNTTGIELTNVEKALNIFTKMINKLSEDVGVLTTENLRLGTQVMNFSLENKRLHGELKKISEHASNIEAQLSTMTDENKKLHEEVEKLTTLIEGFKKTYGIQENGN